MCRLSAFIGQPICAADLVTRPSRSIIQQSFDARERLAGDASTPGYLNGDGFGLGWYSADRDDPFPCVYRQARPAWNDSNLGMIAEKIYSPLLFAHVRAASPGMDVSETTCHPFRFGRYIWMHNGGLSGFAVLRRALLHTLEDDAFDFAVTNGSSDSAFCFAIFLNLIPDKNARCSPDQMRQRLDDTIVILRDAILENGVKSLSLLNFVVSDGESLAASRFALDPDMPDAPAASLYYASGNNYVANQGSPGDYHMVHVDRRASLAIVSSEPLTECRNDWVPLPKNHILVITSSIHILMFKVGEYKTSMRRTVANQLTEGRPSVPTEQCGDALKCQSIFDVEKCSGTSHPLCRVGLGFPSQAQLSNSGAEAENDQQVVLQRAIHTQVDAQNSPVLNARPPRATVSLGPSSSSVRYIVQSAEHAILSMTVCGMLLCSGTQDGSIRVWHVQHRVELAVLREHNSAVLALTWDAASSTLISASSDSHICFWRLTDPGIYARMLKVPCSGNGDIFSLAIANRFIFAGCSDAVIRRMNVDIDSIVEHFFDSIGDGMDDTNANDDEFHVTANIFPSCSDICGARALSSSSVAVSDVAVSCGSVQSLSTARNNISEDIGEYYHFGFIYALEVCGAGRYLCSGCGDGIVRVWNLEQGMYCKALEGHSGAVLALASVDEPECKLLCSGSRDGSVKVWDVESDFLCKRTIRMHNEEIVSCVASSNIVLTGSADGQVCLWHAKTFHCVGKYGTRSLRAAAMSVVNELVFLASSTSEIEACDLIPLDLMGLGKPCESMANDVGMCQSWSKTSGSDMTQSFLADMSPPGTDLRRGGEKHVQDAVGGVEFDGNDDNSRDARRCRSCKELNAGTIFGNDGLGNNTATRSRSAQALSTGPALELDQERLNFINERDLERDLRRLISMKSISGSDEHREDCWQAAKFLAFLLEGMGAQVKRIVPPLSCDTAGQIPNSSKSRPASSNKNPIVLAKFHSKCDSAPTVLLYGHYDVMPAVEGNWDTDPWSLSAVDGHYYGRGVTDNKGPTLAMIYALRGLLDELKDGLGVHVGMILEGEGEQSNDGLREAMMAHDSWFKNTTLILTSNSYWLGEERPCINYGMRGVIELHVSVSGAQRNLHSGVDGGAIIEPVADLVGILATLVDCHGMAHIPGFYDDVRPLTTRDRQRLQEVQYRLDEYRNRTGVQKFTSSNATELLEARWRRPSISITSLSTSNQDNLYSVMPMEASAKVSVRFVPDQDPEKLTNAIRTHLHLEFDKRRSGNTLTVSFAGHGDYWISDPSSAGYQLAERAVKCVWGVNPMYVCEGGTLSIFSFLANRLGAPVVQVPLGQASDNAHLPNERIRTINLYRGRDVFKFIIRELSEMYAQATSTSTHDELQALDT